MSTHSKPKIFWNFAGREDDIPVIQPMIRQRRDACSFAAVSRQIEYQLRISYAWAAALSQLRQGALIDHEKWQFEFENKGLLERRHRKPNLLLEAAKNEGVPLWNGLRHKIEFSHMRLNPSKATILKLLNDGPLVGVFEIRANYPQNGEVPYRAIESPCIDKHAVVLVGETESNFGETFWIYQNADGDPNKSSMGNGINTVQHELITEIHQGISFPVEVQVRRNNVNSVMRHRYR